MISKDFIGRLALILGGGLLFVTITSKINTLILPEINPIIVVIIGLILVWWGEKYL